MIIVCVCLYMIVGFCFFHFNALRQVFSHEACQPSSRSHQPRVSSLGFEWSNFEVQNDAKCRGQVALRRTSREIQGSASGVSTTSASRLRSALQHASNKKEEKHCKKKEMLAYIKICKIVRVPMEVVKDCWIVEDWQRAAHWHFALSLFALFRFWQKQMRICSRNNGSLQWPIKTVDCLHLVSYPSRAVPSLCERSLACWTFHMKLTGTIRYFSYRLPKDQTPSVPLRTDCAGLSQTHQTSLTKSWGILNHKPRCQSKWYDTPAYSMLDMLRQGLLLMALMRLPPCQKKNRQWSLQSQRRFRSFQRQLGAFNKHIARQLGHIWIVFHLIARLLHIRLVNHGKKPRCCISHRNTAHRTTQLHIFIHLPHLAVRSLSQTKAQSYPRWFHPGYPEITQVKWIEMRSKKGNTLSRTIMSHVAC